MGCYRRCGRCVEILAEHETAGLLCGGWHHRRAGQPLPAVIQGIRAALGAPTDAPDEWYRAGTVWRCAGGQVKACTVGRISCVLGHSHQKCNHIYWIRLIV
jgi:hypothetical protein